MRAGDTRFGDAAQAVSDPGALGACPGCGGRFADLAGPTHAFLNASAGCWARFGQALALHFSDHRFWPAHHLLTDAYALQHSGGPDLKAMRATHVHLGALYAQLRLGQSETRVIALRRALSAFDFNPLTAPRPTPSVSILDVDISEPGRHLATAQAYAEAVLRDWRAHHRLAERLCLI